MEMSGLSQEDIDEIIEFADAEALRIEKEEIAAAEERKRNPPPAESGANSAPPAAATAEAGQEKNHRRKPLRMKLIPLQLMKLPANRPKEQVVRTLSQRMP